ncbi:O-antigen ligase domain-containing protein, partial [bacterium]|nr:O-antigen ligase domain-containing protein [bacterium]
MNAGRAAEREDLVWYSLLVVVLLAPVAIGGLGQGRWLLHDPYVTPKLIVLAFAVLLGSTGLILRLAARKALYWNRIYSLPILLLGGAALSAMFGVARYSALLGSPDRQGLMTWFMFVCLGLFAMQAIRTPRQARTLQAALVAGSVPVALLALLQVTGLDPIKWGSGVAPWMLSRGVSTLGNPDHLGGYLVLPLVLAPTLALTEPDSAKRLLVWGSFGITAVAWFASMTRAAWFGGLMGLLLLALAASRGRLRLRPADLGALGVSGAALSALAVASAPTVASRVAAMFSSEGVVASGRLEIWRAGLMSLSDRWLLGYGPDSFRYAFMEHASASFSSTYADDAHNYPLLIAVTLGIPALLVALSFIALVMRQSIDDTIVRRDDPRRFTMAGWLAASFAYSVYLLFGPSSLAPTALLWVSLGVLCS